MLQKLESSSLFSCYSASGHTQEKVVCCRAAEGERDIVIINLVCLLTLYGPLWLFLKCFVDKVVVGWCFLCVCLQVVLSRGEVEGVDMDAQSCVDHSILAIFEDSTVASGVRVKADQ